MTEAIQFDEVEHFTAGAVGEPGSRVFYLQVGLRAAPLSLKCEKQQVAALGEYLAGLMADLPETPAAGDPMDLIEPVLAEWVVGRLAGAYDESADRVVLVIEESVPELDEPDEDEELDPEEGSSVRLRLTRAQVVAFVDRAAELVSAGRPACELCGHPRGPDHTCPRTNGHGPPR